MFAAPLVFIPATYFHSRESGNLPESLTVFWHRAPKQLDDREIPAFAGMESGGRFSLSREWEGGGTVKLKELPFRRKPESLRQSRIRQRRLLQCSASRKILAVARMRFRLSPEWKVGGEIFAFAGMGGGRDGEIKRTSIPAKAGISAAKPHSPKATIAMFRFAENSRCRENEIPAFAGMESGGGDFRFRGNGRGEGR